MDYKAGNLSKTKIIKTSLWQRQKRKWSSTRLHKAGDWKSSKKVNRDRCRYHSADVSSVNTRTVSITTLLQAQLHTARQTSGQPAIF